MSKELTPHGRKIWVANNFVAVIIFLIAHLRNEYLGLNYGFLGVEIFAFIVVLISFYKVFWKTRLWHLTHTNFKNVDKRQVMVIYNSLRWSYGIFTILALVIMYFFALTGELKISVVLLACLLYVAHILPAAIIAWTEKEIQN